MTANLKTWDPSGPDGNPVILTGTPLLAVNKTGGGTIDYEADAGMSRGNEIGVRFAAPTDTDQANIHLSTAAAAGGTIRKYVAFKQWPSLTIPMFDLRSSTANLIRAALTSAGVLNCQNSAGGPPGGALSGSLFSFALDTIYRLELAAIPGAAAVTPFDGQGWLRVYDDSEVLQFSGTIANGNFGITQPSLMRSGDSTTGAGSAAGLIMWGTQFAIDTAATPPTIPPVTKNVPPVVISGNYPKIAAGGVWV